MWGSTLLVLVGAALASPDAVLDVESDPVNWVLGGGSLHAGLQLDRVRVGLGLHPLKEPELFHGNPDIDLYQSFETLRLGYGFGPNKRGFHVDLIAERARAEVIQRGTDRVGVARFGTAGVELGGRVPLVGGLYVHPFLVAEARIAGPDTVRAGRATYEVPPWIVLPLIHLGYMATPGKGVRP